MAKPHFHIDAKGFLHECYHDCKNAVVSWKFWVGVTVVNTLEFIPEHLVWFRTEPFKYIAVHWLGTS